MKSSLILVLVTLLFIVGFVCLNNGTAYARDSITIERGKTVDDVFVMGKDIYVYGEVEESAVSLGGNIYVEFGGHVGENAVTIDGDVYVRSGSEVEGDVVTIGGTSHISTGAEINGSLVDIMSILDGFGHHDFDFDGIQFPNILRLIVLGPFAGAFGIIGAIIGLSISMVKVLISLGIAAFLTYLMPGNMVAMSNYLRRSPIKTFFIGLLGIVLVPFFFIGFIITVIGIPLVPLLIIFIILSYLIGSVGISLWIGRMFPNGEMRSPMRNVVIGVLTIALLKLIPGIGFVTGMLVFFMSIGLVLLSGFGNRQTAG